MCVYEKRRSSDRIEEEGKEAKTQVITLQGYARHDSDATDLQWVSEDEFIASSSAGSVSLYSWNPSEGVRGKNQWDLGSPITSLSVTMPNKSRFGYFSKPKADRAVAVTEAGDVHILSLDRKETVKQKTPMALFASAFANETTLLLAGMGGRLMEWDIRLSSKENCAMRMRGSFTDSYSPSLVSVASHPARDNLAATGSSNGLLSLWDRRRSTQPIFSLEALQAPMWDVCFLPSNPALLMSADNYGGLRLWDFNRSGQDAHQVTYQQDQQNEVHLSTLYNNSLSINSLSVSEMDQTTVLAATDAESLLIYTQR